jgi:hypothetical protein
VIVRIFNEGQYELPETALPRLHELDEQVQAAIDHGDEPRFHELYPRLLEQIRQHGTSLAGDDLRPSELILPPPETTLAEAAREFHGHGLIPE